LKPRCEESLSSFAFKSNLRRYSTASKFTTILFSSLIFASHYTPQSLGNAVQIDRCLTPS
jgi:hypothetical protein